MRMQHFHFMYSKNILLLAKPMHPTARIVELLFVKDGRTLNEGVRPDLVETRVASSFSAKAKSDGRILFSKNCLSRRHSASFRYYSHVGAPLSSVSFVFGSWRGYMLSFLHQSDCQILDRQLTASVWNETRSRHRLI